MAFDSSREDAGRVIACWPCPLGSRRRTLYRVSDAGDWPIAYAQNLMQRPLVTGRTAPKKRWTV